MHKSGFYFSPQEFNLLYPFYLLTDENLNIVSVGKSLHKLFPDLLEKSFFEVAELKRPTLEKHSAAELKTLNQQLLVWQVNNQAQFRGQVLWVEEKKEFLFIGSPWFQTVDDLVASQLSFSDFALHDPQIDLLHILKNQEINVAELKELLAKINSQKNELKAASKALKDMSLFPMQNPDPLLRLDEDGNILLMNPAAEKLDSVVYKDRHFSFSAFWKWIHSEINRTSARWMVEVKIGQEDYSFLCKYLPEAGYCNIYGRNITSEKASQAEINRLSLVASLNENGVLFTDREGKITWANQGFAGMSGYSIVEILNKTPLELLRGPSTDKVGIREMIEAFENGQNFLVELSSHKKDGTQFWTRAKGQAVCDEKGEVSQYFALIEDITQEKNQEEQIRILSLIAEENQLGVIIANAEGCITWVNRSFERVSGYTMQEVLGRKPGHVLQGPDTDPITVQYLKKQIETGQPFVCEILNYQKSGKPYWLKIQGQALRNKKGEISGYFALEEDVTLEKENQEALRLSEQRWQFALEGAGDGVWEYNYATGKSYFSNPYKKMLGYGPDDDFGDDYLSFESRVHPEDRFILKETERDYRNTFLNTHQREFRMQKKSGEYIWILDRGMVLERDQKGKAVKLIGTHTDITERKEAEARLQVKEEKYRNILANMNLGILEVDLDQKIMYANQSFCDISGFELDEIMGKNAVDFLIQGENKGILEEKNQMRKSGKSDAYEILVKNKRGEPRWWLVSGAPSFNDKGQQTGSIGIHLDITDQKNLQEELLEARELAEASARAKETFLANMSHEIRTPMHAIAGMIGLLEGTKLVERQRFFLNNIKMASEHMMIILNDILDLSKIEAGQLGVEKVGFHWHDVFQRAIQVMKHRAEEKGLLLLLEMSPTLEKVICLGDPFRLNQILLNLLSNAIKFTEKGHIKIKSEGNLENENQIQVLIKVEDTGIGMEPEFLSQIFDKFSQESTPQNQTKGGTGLGMNICRQLVELMGGKIWVESEKGKGSTFSFQIPFTVAESIEIQKDKTQFTPSSDFWPGLKILVVDDNDMNRLVASTLIEPLGATVTEAVNGKNAIDRVREEQPDVILMDIQMPVMDGMEATQIIRNEQKSKIPIIALTANAIRGEEKKYLDAGMDAYLSKPFTQAELIAAVEKVLNQTRSEAKTIETDVQSSSNALFDLSNLEKIASGNHAFVRKMVDLFLNQTPPMLEEMKQAFSVGDGQKVAALAHKMKPSLDNLGVKSLFQTIRNLEKYPSEPQNHSQTIEDLDLLEKTLFQVFSEMKSQLFL